MSLAKVTSLAKVDGSQETTLDDLFSGRAKAWARVEATSGTPSLADSLNMSSVTDNGVGDYTLNFTAAFGTANYAYAVGTDTGTGAGRTSAQAAGSYRYTELNTSFAAADGDSGAIFHGDF